MSASSDIQKAVTDLMAACPAIATANIPVIQYRPKEIASEAENAAAQFGVFVQVLPPLPTRFEQGSPIVFFSKAEVRVRIIEYPDLNVSGLDAYDIADQAFLWLHWRPDGLGSRVVDPGDPLRGVLSHPLELASRPCEMQEKEIPDIRGGTKETRILDVIFEASYELANSA